jgi:threonine synthase
MGLPVKKLICASNSNNVLTDFLTTGKYDKNRKFFTTASPSMDILISSNLERLLYLLCDEDDIKVRGWMASLKSSGVYSVGEEMLNKIESVFAAGYCDDEGTKQAIAKTYMDFRYLCDTHTGVAIKVYYDYRDKTGDNTPTVIASTASPFKFCANVLDAVSPGSAEGMDEFDLVNKLAGLTGLECPPQLANLASKRSGLRIAAQKTRWKKKCLKSAWGDYMSLFVIGDTHLSLGSDKPMDIFSGWENYEHRPKKTGVQLSKTRTQWLLPETFHGDGA